MKPPEPAVRCTKEGCSAANGGACLDGHDLATCPNATVSALGVTGSDTRITFHSGLELDSEEVGAVTKDEWTRLVVLAGPEGSGKTTLLTSIYESFKEGPFAGYQFNASLTLPALERTCHDSRIASGRLEPITVRTPHGESRRYLHLAVDRVGLEEPQNVLFCDLAGEQYRLAMDSQDECRRLGFANRADHFAVLMDGQKLAQLDTRASVYQQGRRLLRSFLDAGMIGPNTLLQIVFSKWDIVETDASAKKYVEEVEIGLTESFRDSVGGWKAFRVAARPTGEGTLKFAHNVDSLLATWISESLFFQPSQTDTSLPELVSEFDRLASRPLPIPS